MAGGRECKEAARRSRKSGPPVSREKLFLKAAVARHRVHVAKLRACNLSIVSGSCVSRSAGPTVALGEGGRSRCNGWSAWCCLPSWSHGTLAPRAACRGPTTVTRCSRPLATGAAPRTASRFSRLPASSDPYRQTRYWGFNWVSPKVIEVSPGGPAAGAGLATGDVILEVDHQSVGDWAQSGKRIVDLLPVANASSHSIHVQRGTQTLDVTISPAAATTAPITSSSPGNPPPPTAPRW
jgi:hypothetical protein